MCPIFQLPLSLYSSPLSLLFHPFLRQRPLSFLAPPFLGLLRRLHLPFLTSRRIPFSLISPFLCSFFRCRRVRVGEGVEVGRPYGPGLPGFVPKLLLLYGVSRIGKSR